MIIKKILGKISNSAAEQKLADVTGNLTGYITSGSNPGVPGGSKADRLMEEITNIVTVIFSDQNIFDENLISNNDLGTNEIFNMPHLKYLTGLYSLHSTVDCL